MEVGGLDIERSHFGVGDLDALCVGGVIEPACDGEAGVGGGVGDQLNDDMMADQWLASPVLGDECE